MKYPPAYNIVLQLTNIRNTFYLTETYLVCADAYPDTVVQSVDVDTTQHRAQPACRALAAALLPPSLPPPQTH